MARGRRPKHETNPSDLLRALQADSDRTDKELAGLLGVYPTWIHRRKRLLRDRGYIRANRAIVDTEKIGLDMLAFIALRLKDSDLERGRKTAEWIAKFENVQEVHHVTGDFDILVKLRGKAARDQRRFLAHLSVDGNIERPLTLIVTGTVIETTEIVINERDALAVDADISRNGGDGSEPEASLGTEPVSDDEARD